jgi:hypothetical protein
MRSMPTNRRTSDGQHSRGNRFLLVRLGRGLGDVLMSRIREKIAHRNLVLKRCEELTMEMTRRALQASLETKKEPDDVDAAVWALRNSVVLLIELRHKNSTADRVMDEERMIRGSASALQGLLDDLWESNFNTLIEAAE